MNHSINKTAGMTNSKQQDELWQMYTKDLRTGADQSFADQLAHFNQIYANRQEKDGPPLIWQPKREQFTNSNIGKFMKEGGFKNYTELHHWSIKNRMEFWRKVIKRLGIRFSKEPATILDLKDGVKNPRWLSGAELNCTDSCFKARPDKTAIISAKEGSSNLAITTYAELESMVNRIANGFRELGLKSGERIALYMPMTTECVATYLGIIRAGYQVVSIADSFSSSEVKRRMDIANTKWIVTVPSYLRAHRQIELYQKIKEVGASRAIVIPASDATPSPEKTDLRDTDLIWDDFLSTVDTFSSQTNHPYTITNVLFSSGTTGTPKIIPWTHLTPIKCAMDGHFHQDIHVNDVVGWPTNIGWMMGPWLIYATFINEATMALYEGTPLGAEFINFVVEAKVSILGVIPSLVRAWRTSGVLDEMDWNNVRCFSSTGEPSNFEDYLWLMSRTGYRAPIIEYLGGTEIGGGHITGCMIQPASPATFTTPALGIDIVLLNEKNSPINESEAGELYLIPPSIGLSQELLNEDHEEIYYEKCPKGPEGEILRRHGDQFAKLPNSFFKALGRSDDTMNLSGIKVSSLELEEVIVDHEYVFESAAVAVQPKEEGQDILVLFVVLNKAIEEKQLITELNTMIAKRLNPLFKIHDLVIMDKLPRTASNKLMRRELRSSYQDKRDL